MVVRTGVERCGSGQHAVRLLYRVGWTRPRTSVQGACTYRSTRAATYHGRTATEITGRSCDHGDIFGAGACHLCGHNLAAAYEFTSHVPLAVERAGTIGHACRELHAAHVCHDYWATLIKKFFTSFKINLPPSSSLPPSALFVLFFPPPQMSSEVKDLWEKGERAVRYLSMLILKLMCMRCASPLRPLSSFR